VVLAQSANYNTIFLEAGGGLRGIVIQPYFTCALRGMDTRVRVLVNVY